MWYNSNRIESRSSSPWVYKKLHFVEFILFGLNLVFKIQAQRCHSYSIYIQYLYSIAMCHISCAEHLLSSPHASLLHHPSVVCFPRVRIACAFGIRLYHHKLCMDLFWSFDSSTHPDRAIFFRASALGKEPVFALVIVSQFSTVRFYFIFSPKIAQMLFGSTKCLGIARAESVVKQAYRWDRISSCWAVDALAVA